MGRMELCLQLLYVTSFFVYYRDYLVDKQKRTRLNQVRLSNWGMQWDWERQPFRKPTSPLMGTNLVLATLAHRSNSSEVCSYQKLFLSLL